MKSFKQLLLFIPFLLQSYHTTNNKLAPQDSRKWVSLFNGKNLSNWKPKITGYPLGENFGNTFRVKDKILSTRYDQYDSFNNRFGALYYDKKFTNYRLKVEYRFAGELTPGAPAWGFQDGGVQYHCQPPATVGLNQQFPVCLEYNFHGKKDATERPTGEICVSGIYIEMSGARNKSNCTPPMVKRSFAGDQWVTAEVEVKDGKITHFVNGEQIIQFENPRFDSTHKEAKKFIIAGNDKVTEGYISLQSNSHPMDFRKIEIMEY